MVSRPNHADARQQQRVKKIIFFSVGLALVSIIIGITQEQVIALKDAQIEELKALLEKQATQIAFLQSQLFGSTSEKMDPNQTELFNEGEEMGKPAPLPDVPADEQEEEKSNDADKPKSTRKKKTDIFPENLKVEVVEVNIPDEVKANPELYWKTGERHHDLLHHQRAELLWRRKVTEQYVRKDQKEAPPVSSPAPPPPIEGASITPELAAQLIIAKYCDHLPHYRQSGIFSREQGVDLSRQTINKWTHAIADHLHGIAEAIGRELKSADVLQLDETPIKYLLPGNGKTKQGYYWVMRNPETGEVYFHWETTRGKDGLKRTLGWDTETNSLDFTGMIQCDGYTAYNSLQKELAGIKLGGCLAHIRRKFLQDEGFTDLAWGKELIGQIQELYRVEKEITNAPPDERRRVRQEKAKPIVDQLKQTLITQQSSRPKSAIGEAIRYALGQWESFELYLENGKLEIDNNGVENAIRPTKLGVKNHLFIGSAEAGTNSAILYTIVENCRALHLNPRDYLVEAITMVNTIDASDLTPAKYRQKLEKEMPVAA